MNAPPINMLSPCVVHGRDRGYSAVMSYDKAVKLAMHIAAGGEPSRVYRLIEETSFAGNAEYGSKVQR